MSDEQRTSNQKLTHERACPALARPLEDDCTCGLQWRIQLQTEQTLHAAWRKRAEEAEAELATLRAAHEPSEVRHGPCPCCGTEWTPNVAPIARVEIIGGEVSQTEIYAPGLPDGDHDLFPVPLNPNGAVVTEYQRGFDDGFKRAAESFRASQPPNERLAALELELATIKKYARQCDLDAAAYELIEIEDRASATKEESR